MDDLTANEQHLIKSGLKSRFCGPQKVLNVKSLCEHLNSAIFMWKFKFIIKVPFLCNTANLQDYLNFRTKLRIPREPPSQSLVHSVNKYHSHIFPFNQISFHSKYIRK